MVKESRRDIIIREAREGRDVRDIARDLGLDVSYIYRIMKEYGIQRKGCIKVKELISPTHYLLGRLIRKERIYKNEEESKKDFARNIGLSTQRVNWIEKGYYDPTLTDLIKIFSVLGIKFSEIDYLLEPKEDSEEIEETE